MFWRMVKKYRVRLHLNDLSEISWAPQQEWKSNVLRPVDIGSLQNCYAFVLRLFYFWKLFIINDIQEFWRSSFLLPLFSSDCERWTSLWNSQGKSVQKSYQLFGTLQFSLVHETTQISRKNSLRFTTKKIYSSVIHFTSFHFNGVHLKGACRSLTDT